MTDKCYKVCQPSNSSELTNKDKTCLSNCQGKPNRLSGCISDSLTHHHLPYRPIFRILYVKDDSPRRSADRVFPHHSRYRLADVRTTAREGKTGEHVTKSSWCWCMRVMITIMCKRYLGETSMRRCYCLNRLFKRC